MLHDEGSSVFHKSIALTFAVLVSCPTFVFGQAKPAAQLFVVCASQENQPTVYWSGVLQGPATALASFRADFNTFLAQHYAYKGAVACGPANTAANAQKFIEARSTALRNAKKNVVDTGWTEGGGALASVAGALSGVQSTMPQVKAAASTAAAAVPAAPSSAAANGNAGGATQLSSVLGTIFGTGGGTNTAAATGGGCNDTSTPAAKAAQAKSGSAAGGTTANGASGSGSSGCQSPFQQVSSALASAFASNSGGGSASANSSSKSSQPTVPANGLGSAQAQNTKLVVYGCGRQDTQVACVTDLANQNQKETLVQAGDIWKDAFIVDDRGDRHLRTSGFFLNVDGEQRPQLDISYGKSTRFILMFDGVPTKVQKVALRSATGGLDVEDISLIGAGAPSAQQH
jgi:hypothetical protein